MKLINSIENFQKYNIMFSSCGHRFKEYINNYKISQISTATLPSVESHFPFPAIYPSKRSSKHSFSQNPSQYLRKKGEREEVSPSVYKETYQRGR